LKNFEKAGLMKIAFVLAAYCIFLFLFSTTLCADDYQILWADTIDNGGWDGASCVAVDSANDIIVAGCSFIGGDNDYFVVKYDSDGMVLWQDTVDNGGEDLAEDVAVDLSNNVIVTGYSMIGGDHDYFTIKYDANGTILWQDTLDNGGLYDIARGVAVDHSNNIIVTGYCDIGSDCVYFTVKYDSTGAVIWADTLNNGPYDSALGIAVDNLNNIAVTGYTSDGANNDYFTVKYDSNGTIIWQDIIDIQEFDQAYGIAAGNAQEIMVTGCSGGPFDDYDFFTVKYDSDGSVIWADTLDNGTNDDVAYDVAVDDSNHGYVTGYSLEPAGNHDYFTIKYGAGGGILWQDTLDNGDDDIANGIAVDHDGNVILTGRSYISDDFDYFTVKYAPVQGVAERGVPNNSPGKIRCHAYPNPFSKLVEIRLYGVSENRGIGETELQIFDVTGRKVRQISLLPFNFLLGVSWDGRDDEGKVLPTGTYFMVVETESCKATEKLLLIR
jgi:hypothetical protein